MEIFVQFVFSNLIKSNKKKFYKIFIILMEINQNVLSILFIINLNSKISEFVIVF